jgi:hypothetical protein
MTIAANPWNAVYNLAVGKRNTSTQITTLRKLNGSLTADTKETTPNAGLLHPGGQQTGRQ